MCVPLGLAGVGKNLTQLVDVLCCAALQLQQQLRPAGALTSRLVVLCSDPARVGKGGYETALSCVVLRHQAIAAAAALDLRPGDGLGVIKA